MEEILSKLKGSPLRTRWRWALGTTASMAVIASAGIAWACVAPVSLTVNPASVQPGGTVSVIGRNTAPGAPIEIHLDSPTGRLLATNPPHNLSVMSGQWTLSVPIPADVPTGKHLIFSVEDYHNHNGGQPARATIYVGQPAEAAPSPPVRPTKLEVGSGPSAATLGLVGLGVAGLALFVAGVWYLAASRRSPGPQAQEVRTS